MRVWPVGRRGGQLRQHSPAAITHRSSRRAAPPGRPARPLQPLPCGAPWPAGPPAAARGAAMTSLRPRQRPLPCLAVSASGGASEGSGGGGEPSEWHGWHGCVCRRMSWHLCAGCRGARGGAWHRALERQGAQGAGSAELLSRFAGRNWGCDKRSAEGPAGVECSRTSAAGAANARSRRSSSGQRACSTHCPTCSPPAFLVLLSLRMDTRTLVPFRCRQYFGGAKGWLALTGRRKGGRATDRRRL